jgi:hypothetical protein
MTTTVKYIGTLNPYFELAVTGKPTKWTPGRTADVSDGDALLLIATGLFEVYADRVLPFVFGANGQISGVRMPDGTVSPFSSARLHGDIRALLLASTTKASVHAVSGVVSTGPGRLFGVWIVHPGATTPTIKAWDNASAASGDVLREAASTEIARGRFLYCGPDGIPVKNGIYLQLGGGTAPIVVLAFEGTYPVVAYTGSERWFDGTDGNDAWNGQAPTYQGGVTGPRKSFSTGGSGADASYATGNWRFYFKRGTSVEQWRNGGGSFSIAGTNIYFGAYGDTSLPKPVMFRTQATQDSGMQFDLTATSGNLGIEDMRFEFTGASVGSGSFMLAHRGIVCHFNRCESQNYTNAFTFGGNYARVVDCSSTTCSQGVLWGDTSYAAPNYSLVFRHTARGCGADAWSVHDGTGTGLGQVILACDGDAGTESCLDVQPQFASGLVAYNIGQRPLGAGSAPLAALDCGTSGNWSLIGNVWIDNSASHTCYVKGPGHVLVGNYLESGATNNGPCLGFWSTATGSLLLNNTLVMRSTGARNLLDMAGDNLAGSGGTAQNNILVSGANSGFRVLRFFNAANATAWARNGNCYWAPNGATMSDGTTTHATVAAYFAAVRPGNDAASVNVDPALVSSYQLPAGSQLIGEGVAQTECFLGRFGPIWRFTAPPIGLHQP